MNFVGLNVLAEREISPSTEGDQRSSQIFDETVQLVGKRTFDSIANQFEIETSPITATDRSSSENSSQIQTSRGKSLEFILEKQSELSRELGLKRPSRELKRPKHLEAFEVDFEGESQGKIFEECLSGLGELKKAKLNSSVDDLSEELFLKRSFLEDLTIIQDVLGSKESEVDLENGFPEEDLILIPCRTEAVISKKRFEDKPLSKAQADRVLGALNENQGGVGDLLLRDFLEIEGEPLPVNPFSELDRVFLQSLLEVIKDLAYEKNSSLLGGFSKNQFQTILGWVEDQYWTNRCRNLVKTDFLLEELLLVKEYKKTKMEAFNISKELYEINKSGYPLYSDLSLYRSWREIDRLTVEEIDQKISVLLD